jgi:hypothetical protein
MVEGHFCRLLESGLDTCGPRRTPMWMAVLDTRSGRPPEREHVPQRVYRLIGAPRGCTLYWDQPLVAAAHGLSKAAGKPEYARAADDYIRAFLAGCVDARGMFRWGNHQYYDAYEDRVVEFSGGHHELRPFAPAWELFWRLDARATERYIRVMASRHVYDAATGAFNRHDDGRRGHAFLEAGGILAESLAWLSGRVGASDLADMAMRIACYNYNYRGAATGLVANEPDGGRWDSRVCTTEVGLWAGSLLKAARYSGCARFAEMAREAVRAYLRYGYDERNGMYFGQLSIADGSPVVPSNRGYWPGEHTDIWSVEQWPTHDYPMALAEACLGLFETFGDGAFLEGARRWAEVVCRNTPARGGQGTYAEHYGRCIHFLTRAAPVVGDASLLSHARALADEAVEQLWDGGMFQTYPGTHMYESVGGLGFLFQALIYLECGNEACVLENSF